MQHDARWPANCWRCVSPLLPGCDHAAGRRGTNNDQAPSLQSAKNGGSWGCFDASVYVVMVERGYISLFSSRVLCFEVHGPLMSHIENYITSQVYSLKEDLIHEKFIFRIKCSFLTMMWLVNLNNNTNNHNCNPQAREDFKTFLYIITSISN